MEVRGNFDAEDQECAAADGLVCLAQGGVVDSFCPEAQVLIFPT